MESKGQLQITRILSISVIITLFLSKVIAQDAPDLNSINSIDELKAGIEYILEDTNTPGAAIAMVSGDSVIMSSGFGLADKEKGIESDENTMFRIGSTSKMFVALSILKLQEEGKVNLKDKVRDLVPEIEFQNKWAATNPILVEHLFLLFLLLSLN